MNAVLDKPRAKVTRRPAAKKIEPPPVTISAIRNWITAAEEKLEMAYDSAELGGPIDMLLDHINHDVILEPNRIIQRDDLTQADAKRVYEGLFAVLACLQGAIKLAEGSVLQATLEEALALLDAAQSALDPVNDAVRSLPEGGLAHDFERGRNLAIKTLKLCDYRNSDYEGFRRHREPGAAQHNFVMEGLVEVLSETSLHEGFAAVLSGAIGSVIIDADYFGTLTLAETQNGVPGEDGTQAVNDDAGTEGNVLPSSYSAAFAFDAHCRVTEAEAILDSRMHDMNSGAAYGALTLVGIAKAKTAAVEVRATRETCDEASNALHEAIEVLGIVTNDHSDLASEGAFALLKLAKRLIDDNVGALP